MKGWRPIAEFDLPDGEEVDVWMDIPASPLSMGIAAEFRVPDAYRIDGRWFHISRDTQAELRADCITHWSEKLGPPGSN